MSKIADLSEVGHLLDVWLPGKIFYDQTPGLAVGIVHKGKLVYARGIGYADVARKLKVTSETNFRVASISKMFTTIAILQLEEQKKLKLTDLVGTHLSWIKGPVAKLSIKQLLSHTSGMLRDGDTAHWSSDAFPDTETFKESINRLDVLRKYRDDFKYSNFGFSLLGLLIEHLSGMSYTSYMSRILKKAGMNNTFPDLADAPLSSLATGYSRHIPKQQQSPFKHTATRAYAPAAGFISNVTDLARFLSEFSSNKLLSKISRQKMMSKIVLSGKDSTSWYGLGCTTTTIKGHSIVGHSGNFIGHRTRVNLDLKNDLGVIVLSNVTSGTATELCKGILELIYELPTLLKKYRGKKITKVDSLEGVYRSRWGDIVVASVGTSLIIFDPKENFPLASPSVLIEKSAGIFEINSKDGFGSRGEEARFESDTLIWGTIPYDKVSMSSE